MTTFLDVETTTHNKGHRFDPRNQLISFVCNDKFHYFLDPDFQIKINRPCVVVGFHTKFDLHWLDIDLEDVSIWDCQLAEFVLNGQTGSFQSLDECLESYGLPPKKKHEVHALWEAGVQTDEIPVVTLKEYNLGDVEPLKLLYQYQQERCSEQQKRLTLLMGEDMKVLMEMERNGILFDKENATKKIASLADEIEKAEANLAAFLPPIEHGTFNWDSGDQISALLYGGRLSFDWATETPAIFQSGAKQGQPYIKRSWFKEEVVFPKLFQPLEKSEVAKTRDDPKATTRFYQTDEPTLRQLRCKSKNHQTLISLLLSRSRAIKIREMLETLFSQFHKFKWENDLIHPQYNQNVARTGRLSSSSPNMQNQPPDIDEFFITRYPD